MIGQRFQHLFGFHFESTALWTDSNVDILFLQQLQAAVPLLLAGQNIHFLWAFDTVRWLCFQNAENATNIKDFNSFWYAILSKKEIYYFTMIYTSKPCLGTLSLPADQVFYPPGQGRTVYIHLTLDLILSPENVYF